MSSISTDPNDCSLQSATNHACSWSVENGMCINEKKTKEMLIHFGTKADINSVPSITANGKIIERVNNFKLLGVVISSDLSWHAHVSYILQKVSKRIFCINNLARAGIYESDIILRGYYMAFFVSLLCTVILVIFARRRRANVTNMTVDIKAIRKKTCNDLFIAWLTRISFTSAL